MNKLFLIMLLSTFSMNNNLFSQGNREITAIKKLLAKELFLVNNYYGESLVINQLYQDDTTHIKINSIKKLTGNYNSFLSGYYLLSVNVSFVCLTKGLNVAKSFTRIDTLDFDYIIVSKFGYSFYKLLGFSNVDIAYLKIQNYSDEKNIFFLNWISDILIKYDVLNKREAKLFTNSLYKEKYTYDVRMHKPINIVNKLHPNRLYQSLILPYEWIKPYSTD